jgi:hypothetical protein
MADADGTIFSLIIAIILLAKFVFFSFSTMLVGEGGSNSLQQHIKNNIFCF